MTKRSYEQIPCPIAHSLRVLGDQWTLMIILDALMGILAGLMDFNIV